METIIYLGKVNFYWILLFCCYWLLLRQHTFFQLNRFYLLGSLAVAFTLPWVIYPETAPVLPVQYEFNAATFTVASQHEVEKPLLSVPQMIWFVYAVGFMICAFRLVKQVLQLRAFINAGEKIKLDDCTVILIDSNNVGSFSFMRWIVINRSDYELHFDAILRHEMVHTSQRHSIDILLVELLKVIFWFNPVFTFYKSALQEIHEFLADKEAPNREHYAQFLVAYALNAPIAALTNHFFKPSQIKTRIKMIYKNRTSKWMLSSYLAAATLIGGTALLVAGCENNSSDPTEESRILTDADKGGKPVFTVVEEQPEYPGGATEMFKFLGKNIRYPSKAAKANISGRVFVSFIVTHEGKIGDITLLKGIGYGCDEEAIRVINKFPNWTPGKQNGHPVNVKYNLPINFQIESSEEANASSRKESKGAEVVYIVDGDIVKSKPELDANKIKSVNVFTGEKAKEKYGDLGKNGVVSIKTKNVSRATAPKPSNVNIATPFEAKSISALSDPTKSTTKSSAISIRGGSFTDASPLVIIDGVKQEGKGQAALEKLDPDDIKSMNVLRNSSATNIYGEEGKDGVIQIVTKKK